MAVEAAPWLKVGGLGDVTGSLPRYLREHGVDARLCLPAHGGVLDRAPSPQRVLSFEVPHAQGALEATVYASDLDGVPVYLVAGPPIPADGVIYTGRIDEEAHRFTFFSLAALEVARRLVSPDVLHCHDWHAALAASAPDQRTLLTIHNLPYAGVGAEVAMAGFGMRRTHDPRVPDGLRGSPLAVGLVSADRLSTVSPGYAREILEPEHGAGFEALLRSRRADLTGVLNGLDLALWDPAKDAGFDADHPAGRAAAEAALRSELRFTDDPDAPLIAIVSRLVHQKGVDLALAALRTLERPFRAVILGTGDPGLEDQVRALARDRPREIRAFLTYDDGLARRIYAGADLMLIPSRYEPCGMTQMIAMRYGCVPVARETGGLADTVLDLDLADQPTGFLFAEPTVGALSFALRRALATHRRGGLEALRRHGMSLDFGWHRSAGDYVQLYRALAGAEPKEGSSP